MATSPPPAPVVATVSSAVASVSAPAPLVAEVVSEATRECRLITGPVALSAQLVLLFCVLTALFLKRHRERPRRAWTVWLLDISKQAFSSGAGHCVGMGVAILVSSWSPVKSSECGWYFVVYFMDASLGITLAITFHRLVNATARWLYHRHISQKDFENDHPWFEALVDIGHYGDAATPNYRKWGVQVVAWVLCVITARTIVGCVVVNAAPWLSIITVALDAKFTGHPDAYLYTVMVAIPLVCNVGQAWVQDQALKWKHKRHPSSKREDDDDQGDGGHYHDMEGGEVGVVNMQPISSYQQISKPSERVGVGASASKT